MDPAKRCVTQNLVNCCTIVGTTGITNPEQIEVMEFEGCIRSTGNKLRASSDDASTVVGVIYKLDRRRVLLTTLSTGRGETF